MIERSHDPDARLTSFVCRGVVTPDMAETEIRDFYSGEPTLNTLWDFTAADISAMTPEALRALARFVGTASHSREGGRTALVFPLEKLMDMKDQLAGLAEFEVKQAQIKIFQDLDRALDWIRG